MFEKKNLIYSNSSEIDINYPWNSYHWALDDDCLPYISYPQTVTDNLAFVTSVCSGKPGIIQCWSTIYSTDDSLETLKSIMKVLSTRLRTSPIFICPVKMPGNVLCTYSMTVHLFDSIGNQNELLAQSTNIPEIISFESLIWYIKNKYSLKEASEGEYKEIITLCAKSGEAEILTSAYKEAKSLGLCCRKPFFKWNYSWIDESVPENYIYFMEILPVNDETASNSQKDAEALEEISREFNESKYSCEISEKMIEFTSEYVPEENMLLIYNMDDFREYWFMEDLITLLDNKFNNLICWNFYYLIDEKQTPVLSFTVDDENQRKDKINYFNIIL